MASRSPALVHVEDPIASDSGGEDDGHAPKRRHKQLVRRSGSFRKLEGISSLVNEWFMTDAALHSRLAKFAEGHIDRSPSFRGDTVHPKNVATQGLSSGGLGGKSEIDHQATVVHEEFCALFEEALEGFLRQNNVSMDQFQEMYKIECAEEKRDGKHFYRWMEIVEFEPFLVMMRAAATSGSGQAGLNALLKHVSELSEEAKATYRKQAALRPLLIQWSPDSFAAVDEFLSGPGKAVPHGLDKSTVKSLSQWKGKLVNKVLVAGVYQTPAPDEEAWARFLSVYTSNMSDEAFQKFVALLEAHVAAAAGSQTEEGKTRRIIWECFDACDPMHTGVVDLHHLLKFADHAGYISSDKQRKKLVAKWSATLIPNGNSECIPLSLENFAKVVREMLSHGGDTGGALTEDSFRERIQHLVTVIRDTT